MAGVKRTKKEEKRPSWDNGTREVKWPTESHHWEGGDALKIIMDKRGYSDEQLAFLMNVSVATVKSWRYNNNGPNCPNFKELCHVLKVDPGYFMEPTPIEKLTKKENPWNIMTKKELRDLYIAFLDLGTFPSIQNDGKKYHYSELSEAGAYVEKAYDILYAWFSKMPGKVQNRISEDALDYLAPKEDD